MTFRAIHFVSLLLTISLLTGCGNVPSVESTKQAVATATADQSLHLTQTAIFTPAATATELPFSGSGPWEATFASGSVGLSGTLYGNNAVAVILAPSYPGGQEGWMPFAQAAGATYRVLAFDFRGYGKSGGERSSADQPADIQGAIQFLKEHGAQKIVLIGAGTGGSAAIKAAPADPAVVGVAVISSPRSVEGLDVSDADLSALKAPSLWLAARNDMTQNIEEMFALVGGSNKNLWIYEGSSLHGTYILEGADSADMQKRLLDFIAAVSG